MTYKPPDSSSDEEDRIREAYSKRPRDERYSPFNPAHLFILQEVERQILRLLRRGGLNPLDKKTILEIGCGTGYWLREFIKWGARPQNLTGVDLLQDRVEEARRLSSTDVRIKCGSARNLEFPDNSFDIVFQSTVFSSILDYSLRQKIALEMLRVTKKDGVVLWYDFHMNNPKNPDVRGVKKTEIFRLFPNCEIELNRITLAPPLVRLLSPYSWLGCYMLARCKIFNTHYLGVIRMSCSPENLSQNFVE